MENRKQEIIDALTEELRNNNKLRHRLGIDGAVDPVASEADGPQDAICWADSSGNNVALAVIID